MARRSRWVGPILPLKRHSAALGEIDAVIGRLLAKPFPLGPAPHHPVQHRADPNLLLVRKVHPPWWICSIQIAHRTEPSIVPAPAALHGPVSALRPDQSMLQRYC